MSLTRLVYYSAILAGWAAFFGWLLAEILFVGRVEGRLSVILVAGTVAASIGAAVSLVAGLANAQWKRLLTRAAIGFAGGAIAGAIGGMVGDFVYSLGLHRAIGWLVMGTAIGVVDGLYEQSRSKVRNGLIGGAIGGLLGGILFDLLIAVGSDMSSCATGFVILGISIGAFIGLAQVVLKDAWLTVLDGYRSGRQLILSQPIILLGKGEHLPLPFLGAANQELEKEHVRITRTSNGNYEVEDLQTKIGTRLNNQPLRAPLVIRDGDVIKFGGNFVRFNERQRQQGDAAVAASRSAASKPIKTPPPPPPGTPRSPDKAGLPNSAAPGPSPPSPQIQTPTQNSASANSTPLRPPPPPPRPKRPG